MTNISHHGKEFGDQFWDNPGDNPGNELLKQKIEEVTFKPIVGSVKDLMKSLSDIQELITGRDQIQLNSTKDTIAKQLHTILSHYSTPTKPTAQKLADILGIGEITIDSIAQLFGEIIILAKQDEYFKNSLFETLFVKVRTRAQYWSKLQDSEHISESEVLFVLGLYCIHSQEAGLKQPRVNGDTSWRKKRIDQLRKLTKDNKNISIDTIVGKLNQSIQKKTILGS